MDDSNARSDRRLPVPDPTVLTTEALMREVQTAKETTALLNAHTREVIALQERLREEQLNAIQREIDLQERQRVERKADSEKALEAALTAQKESYREQAASSALAIAKSETAATEQMKTMHQTFSIALESERRVSTDLKERITAQEQMVATHAAAQMGEGKGKEQSWSVLIASVVGASALVGMIVVAFELMVK